MENKDPSMEMLLKGIQKMENVFGGADTYKVSKRRAKNKLAKASRKRNRNSGKR